MSRNAKSHNEPETHFPYVEGNCQRQRIRDLSRLIETYGGKPSKWVKKSSPAFRIASSLYEYHWYEHPDIGRIEIKRKQVNMP